MTEKGKKITLSGQLWQPDGFREGRLTLEEAKIARLEFGANFVADYELRENYICPGLIDLQLNGGLGYDFTRDPATVAQVAAVLPRWGVTAFLPTYITAPLAIYYTALKWLSANAANLPGAQVLGAHLEGPYLNPAYKGAHPETLIRPPNLTEIKTLLETGGKWVKMVTLAPENLGALEIVQYLSNAGLLVSAGHSGANYAESLAAFEAGVGSATHLFNAMPPLHHRKPGLIGATLTTPGISANLIVDGVHLHPSMVKLTYQQKGVDDIVLITDAMAGMGMPPGRYDLAGQAVIVNETSAYLDDQNHTLAGSILTLNRAIQNMVEFSGCSPAEAVQMATLNPARLLKLDDHLGNLVPGYSADVAVFSPDFQPLLTLVQGEVVFSSTNS